MSVSPLSQDRANLLTRVKKRLRLVTAVSYWRTGKPLTLIREEVIRRELRESIAAKKTGEPPPPTVFGTEDEAEALSPVGRKGVQREIRSYTQPPPLLTNGRTSHRSLDGLVTFSFFSPALWNMTFVR